MKKENIDISIIIISYNTRKLLENCLVSIKKFTKNINYEVIVVDNASTDKSVEYIKKDKQIKLIENKNNLGFSKANNQGIKLSKGKYVVLLNSDTELRNNLMKNMYDWMEDNSSFGVATCRLIYPNGKIQSAGGYFPNLLRVASWMIFQDLPFVDHFIKPFQPHKELSPTKNDKIYEKPTSFDWIAGTYLFIRKVALKDTGNLDEDYFMYTEDVDFCYKMRVNGWGVGYVPEYEIVHHKGASGVSGFAVKQEFKGIKIFFKKHKPKWQHPLLRIVLKLGAIERVVLFYLMGKYDRAKIYAKAFKKI